MPSRVLDCPPGLCVQHGECVVLVLRTHVKHAAVAPWHPHGAFVQLGVVHLIEAPQAQLLRQIGVVVKVTGAQDDRVNLV